MQTPSDQTRQQSFDSGDKQTIMDLVSSEPRIAAAGGDDKKQKSGQRK
jgi:hypothetical protein